MRNAKVLSVALFVCLISIWPSLGLAQDANLTGIWVLSAEGTSTGCTACTPCQSDYPTICGTVICGSFGMGDPDIHVNQTGTSLYASERDPNDHPFTLTGNVSENQVTFTIVGIGITPGVGPATTTYTGTLSGVTVTGTFSGYASWECDVGDGNTVIETATWNGTFTFYKKCNFLIEPKIEKCFGGIGTQCKGDAWLYFYKDENTCLATGWMSVGSILHDRCCFINGNNGFYCDGFSTFSKGNCFREFVNAKSDWQCGNFWSYTFGPYPTGKTTGDNTSQDLRAPRGAQVHPQDESFCQAGRCQVDAKKKTIVIKGWNGCKSCVCE